MRLSPGPGQVHTVRLNNSTLRLENTSTVQTSKLITWKSKILVRNDLLFSDQEKNESNELLEFFQLEPVDAQVDSGSSGFYSNSQFASGKETSFEGQSLHPKNSNESQCIISEVNENENRVTLYKFLFCFAAKQIPCGDCFCYVDLRTWRNIYNCSIADLSELTTVPPLANKLVLTGTKVDTLSDELIQEVKDRGSVQVMDITNNKINYLPQTITKINELQEIMLAGNNFQCSCESSWMIQWLGTFNNLSQSYLVPDYREVVCNKGDFPAVFYLLSDVDMGCYPSRWITAQKVGVGLGVGLLVILFSLIILGLKRSREVKFFVYYYLHVDTVPKDDKNENLDNIEHDAFLCFW